MKTNKLRYVSLFIVLLVLFSTSAAAFTQFDDFNTFYGISANDGDDDTPNDHHNHHIDLPAPFYLYLKPLQVMFRSHPAEAVIAVRTIPFLNHISRAPPLFFS